VANGVCPQEVVAVRKDKNFNNDIENALTFNARQMPFNPVILIHFACHPILPLTHYGLALCAVSADASTLRDSRKTRRVSYCSSISCKAKQAKRHEKNLVFFGGHFDGKTLEYQGKMAKNTPKKHVTILQLLMCFFSRYLSIKVKACCRHKRLWTMGLWTVNPNDFGLPMALPSLLIGGRSASRLQLATCNVSHSDPSASRWPRCKPLFPFSSPILSYPLC
jgi:hypothetical protein